MKEKKFAIQHYSWETNGYEPKVEFILNMAENGFHMHIQVWESDPLREKTEHFQFVHEDSCVEWFVNFAPEINDRYFNFEVNANGCMNVSFRKDRYDSISMAVEDVESLGIETVIRENTWEVDYIVPFTLIKKYILGYEYSEGMAIRTNFYKCGEKTAFPHYGMWNKVDTPKPDFHRPEIFKEIVLD